MSTSLVEPEMLLLGRDIEQDPTALIGYRTGRPLENLTLRIGARARLWSGTRDIPPRALVVGNPARVTMLGMISHVEPVSLRTDTTTAPTAPTTHSDRWPDRHGNPIGPRRVEESKE